MDAGVAVASTQVGDAGVAKTVRVPAQTLHEGGGGGAGEGAGARVLPWDSDASNAEAGLRRVHPRDKLRRVTGVRPDYRPVVAEVRGRQRKQRLGRFVRRDGSDATGSQVRLGRIRFPRGFVVGAAVRAAVAAVGAGSGEAGVGVVRTLRAPLVCIRILFQVAGAGAGGAALLVCGVSIRSRVLSTWRLALFVRLSVSGWRAAARSGGG